MIRMPLAAHGTTTLLVVVSIAIAIALFPSRCSGFGIVALMSPDHRHRRVRLAATTAVLSASTASSDCNDANINININSSTNVPSLLRVETKFVLLETKHPGNVGAAARSMKTMGFTDGLVLVRPNDERVLGRKKCKEAASGALDVLRGAFVVVGADDTSDDASNSTSTNININPGDEAVSLNTSTTASLVNKALELAFGGDNNDDTNIDNNIPIIVCGTGMPVDMSQKRVSQRYVEPRIFFDEIAGPLVRQTATDTAANTNTNSTIRIAFLFGNEKYGMTPQDMAECDVMLGIPTNPEFGSLNLATAVQIISYDWRQALGGFSVSSL